jgi:hypothetical protein
MGRPVPHHELGVIGRQVRRDLGRALEQRRIAGEGVALCQRDERAPLRAVQLRHELDVIFGGGRAGEQVGGPEPECRDHRLAVGLGQVATAEPLGEQLSVAAEIRVDDPDQGRALRRRQPG